MAEINNSTAEGADFVDPTLSESIVPSRTRIIESCQRMVANLKESELRQKNLELGLRPHADMLIDKDKIEGQRLDIIDARDLGYYDVVFKLTELQYEQLISKLNELEVTTSEMSFDFKDDGSDARCAISDSWLFELDDMDIRIAQPSQHKDLDKGKQRSALGLVEIKIKTTEDLTPDVIEQKIQTAFNQIGLEDALTLPDEEAEKNYKLARFLWHHKINLEDLTPEEIASIDQKLVRQEVVQGYSTMVEPGKHKEYLDQTPFAIYHAVYTQEAIFKILQAGGLISTHERFRRGAAVAGQSSGEDLDTGGADSVFTRICSSNDQENSQLYGKCHLIFNPDILDRTDWYGYQEDLYGTTSPTYFSGRVAPERMFERAKNSGLSECNEQMFRYGISADKIIAVATPARGGLRDMIVGILMRSGSENPYDEAAELVRQDLDTIHQKILECGYTQEQANDFTDMDTRFKIIRQLREGGTFEINGVPIEDFFIPAQRVKEFIDITKERMGYPEESRQENVSRDSETQQEPLI